jgi:quinol monooxygenase YgiN
VNKHVYWILELQLRPGKERDFHELMREMVADTRDNEPGTLSYEWSLSKDDATCHIFEHYSNSAAVMVHLAKFGEAYAERFFDMLSPSRFVIYGSPSQLVKDALSVFQPTYMKLADGFTR